MVVYSTTVTSLDFRFFFLPLLFFFTALVAGSSCFAAGFSSVAAALFFAFGCLVCLIADSWLAVDCW
jgi:hypothetical protein